MASNEIDIRDFRHLYPFRSNYLSIKGLKYHYLDEGCGQPVVMLHGNPTWSFYYRDLVRALATEYRVIVPDHIGCGLSEKPSEKNYPFQLENRIDDLACLLRHLEIQENITLIVHDWGGMIGCAYAMNHLDRIRRLVIMNTAGFLPPIHKKIPFRLALIRNLRPLATFMVLGFNIFAWGATFMATGKRLPANVRRGLTAPYNTWNNRRATLKFVQDIPLRPSDPSYAIVCDVDRQLHRLDHIPMMICWGQRDFVFDMDYFREWQRRFPRAETHLFPDAGHYILEDETGHIIALTKDFLKKHSV